MAQALACDNTPSLIEEDGMGKMHISESCLKAAGVMRVTGNLSDTDMTLSRNVLTNASLQQTVKIC